MTPHFLSKEFTFSPENSLWASSKMFFGLKSLLLVPGKSSSFFRRFRDWYYNRVHHFSVLTSLRLILTFRVLLFLRVLRLRLTIDFHEGVIVTVAFRRQRARTWSRTWRRAGRRAWRWTWRTGRAAWLLAMYMINRCGEALFGLIVCKKGCKYGRLFRAPQRHTTKERTYIVVNVREGRCLSTQKLTWLVMSMKGQSCSSFGIKISRARWESATPTASTASQDMQPGDMKLVLWRH